MIDAAGAWADAAFPLLGTTPPMEVGDTDTQTGEPEPLSKVTSDGDPQYAGGTVAAGEALSIPELHSKPDAAASVYLDFDGHYEATWGRYTDLVTPVFDTDGDVETFSTSEIQVITQVWQRVAEDFAPFDLDVTTVDPGDFSNGKALRVAIGGSSTDWYQPQGGNPAGGVAYLRAFTNSAPNVVYVFPKKLSNSPKNIAEASSHESGHGFGLHHQSVYDSDGEKVEEYNRGTSDWAPIMGVGYYSARSTWHNGPSSTSATAFQDELALLSSTQNGFGYRTDDHADLPSSATPLAATGNQRTGAGIIETMDDVDYFSFSTGAGEVTVTVDVAEVGPNLDAVLELYDASGNLLALDDPSQSLGAAITVDVPAGEYTVAVRNHGTYGDLGQYTVETTVTPLIPPTLSLQLATDTIGETAGTVQATLTRHDADVLHALNVDLVASDPDEVAVPSVVTIPEGSASVDFLIDAVPDNRIDGPQTVVVTAGAEGFATVEVQVTVNDETIPEPTAPHDLTDDVTPTFTWKAVENADRYDLWVYNESTETHEVIREENLAETTFTPATPLAAAAYRFWVRAFTADGLASGWSAAMPFAVGSVPEIPAFLEPATVTTDATPTFAWDDVDAAYYDLWLYHQTTNTHEVIREENLVEANFTPTDELPLGDYRVWVRAFNSAGLTNGWSAGWDFTIGSIPDVPILTAPLGNTFETRPTLHWEAVEGAAYYDLWVRNDTTDEQEYVRETQWASNSYTPARDWPSGHYRFWVRAINSQGQASEWSPSAEFSIGIPPAPMLLGPEGTTSSTTPEFTWTVSEGAVRYDLWVYYEPTNTHGLIRDQNVLTTSYVPTTVLEPGRYLFWVRAFNADGLAGPWSLQMEFTVGPVETTLQSASLDESATGELLSTSVANPVESSIAAEPARSTSEETIVATADPAAAHSNRHESAANSAMVDAVLAQWPATAWWRVRDEYDDLTRPIRLAAPARRETVPKLAVAWRCPWSPVVES